MQKRNPPSPWREARWRWHGRGVRDYLQGHFAVGVPFTAQEAAQAPCLRHLSERYSYDVAVAICYELYVRDKVRRQGTAYYFPKKIRAEAA
jgi:hypothetical protein